MDLSRLLLLAGAGLLVYKYAQGAGLLGGGGDGTVPGAGGSGGGGGVTTQPGTGSGSTSTSGNGGGSGNTGGAGGGNGNGGGGGNNGTTPSVYDAQGNRIDTLGHFWLQSASSLDLLPPQYQRDGRRYVRALAAYGAADAIAFVDQQGEVMTVDQWNWHRELAGAAPVDPEMMPALLGSEPRENLISAGEYRARLTAAGLSGLGRLSYAVSDWY